MSANEWMKAVDHASGMNDRWLFIASMVVFGIFAAWVMRYFVRQHERLIADHVEAFSGSSLIGFPRDRHFKQGGAASGIRVVQRAAPGKSRSPTPLP